MVQNPERVRGHSKKLYKPCVRLEIRKSFFSIRVIDPWNSLPERTVSAPSIDSFERQLDKFWSSQDILYNFKKSINIYHSNNTPVDGTGRNSDDSNDLLTSSSDINYG